MLCFNKVKWGESFNVTDYELLEKFRRLSDENKIKFLDFLEQLKALQCTHSDEDDSQE